MSPTGGNNITWEPRIKEESKDLVSQTDHTPVLTIMKDGYYFLNLKVTLSQDVKTMHTVKVEQKSDLVTVVLEGWINTNTRSTGLLGKVVLLPAGYTLWVSIDPPTTDVDLFPSVTHLDVIYMHR